MLHLKKIRVCPNFKAAKSVTSDLFFRNNVSYFQEQ